MAKKTKGRSVEVDMKGVEGGGKVPEGEYVVEVSEVTSELSSENNPYLSWVFKVVDGKQKGKKIWHNTSLQPQALFNLRNVLEALGQEVPDGALKLDLDEVIGLTMGVNVEHETYQGKAKARVVDVFSLDDTEGGEEALSQEELEALSDEDLIAEGKEYEIAPTYTGKGAKKKLDRTALIDAILEAAPEDEEGEGYSQEDLEGMEEADLLETAKEFEVTPTYTGKGAKKKLDKDATITAIMEAQEESSDEEGEEGITQEDLEALDDAELTSKAAEYDVEPSKKKNPKTKKMVLDRDATIEAILEAAEVPEDGEEAGDEEGSEEGPTQEELEAMDDAELTAAAAEYEVELIKKKNPKTKKMVLDRSATIDAILEALVNEEEEGITQEELDSMDDEEIKAKAAELDVEVVTKKNPKTKKQVFDRDATIAAILEASEEDDSDEVTEESLSDLDDAALIEKAGEHDVEPSFTGKGAKKKLDRATTIAAILEALDI